MISNLQIGALAAKHGVAVAVTWDTAYNGSPTYSNGNLTATIPSGSQRIRATASHATTGKYYMEFVVNTQGGNTPTMGVCTSVAANSLGVLVANGGWAQQSNNPYQYDNATYQGPYGTNFVANDVCGMAIDFAAGKIWWSKNNTWLNSGNPGAGTGANWSDIAGTLYPFVYMSSSGAVAVTARFLASSFSYTAPTGFSPW